MSYFLETSGLSKQYGSLWANSDISFQLKEGEIHSIIGENGAGKSTFMKMLSGLIRPDLGEIRVRGKKVEFRSPLDALGAGIGMVYQHFMLVDQMKSLENFILGAEPTKGLGVIDFKAAEISLKKLCDEMSAPFKPASLVSELAVGEQQRLEILRLLYKRSDCLIFDEPTGVLAPQEVDAFLESLRDLKRKGRTILLITHKLHEVMSVSDRISIMRAGKLVKTVSASDVTPRDLAQLMVGHEIETLDQRLARPDVPSEGEAQNTLTFKNVSFKKLKNVDFEIRPGEILGVAGIEGNGQRELAHLILGLDRPESGEIFLFKEDISNLFITERKKKGISFVPEDRHRDGLVLDMSLIENFYLGSRNRFPSRMLFPRARIRADLEKAIRDYGIRCSGPESKAQSLSGGNQQKVIIARELLGSPKLLVAAQPTRGVDIGAIQTIHEEFIKRRNSGLSILLISSELEELLALSDRILVLREGEITAEIKELGKDWQNLKYQIGEAMVCRS